MSCTCWLHTTNAANLIKAFATLNRNMAFSFTVVPSRSQTFQNFGEAFSPLVKTILTQLLYLAELSYFLVTLSQTLQCSLQSCLVQLVTELVTDLTCPVRPAVQTSDTWSTFWNIWRSSLNQFLINTSNDSQSLKLSL